MTGAIVCLECKKSSYKSTQIISPNSKCNLGQYFILFYLLINLFIYFFVCSTTKFGISDIKCFIVVKTILHGTVKGNCRNGKQRKRRWEAVFRNYRDYNGSRL